MADTAEYQVPGASIATMDTVVDNQVDSKAYHAMN
jgi:hypothetical protein